MSDIYRLFTLTMSYNQSGNNHEMYKLKDEEKEAALLLQVKDCVVLPLSEQLCFYKQSAMEEFNDSLERMVDEVISLANEEVKEEGEC